MKQNISLSFALVAVFSLGLVGLMSGCSDQGNTTAADRDELSSYLEEHPELVEEARELEKQWEPGYVEPDEEALSEEQ